MALRLDIRHFLFSLKTFFAAMLALYIALALGLSHPYWAMATVYFVSHPLTGATRSKAAYRVAGTLLGAAAAVVTARATASQYANRSHCSDINLDCLIGVSVAFR